MRRRHVLAALVLVTSGGLTFLLPDASAGTSYASPYTFEQTYGTALRLVRVDLMLKVVEKDPELGYVLFEYKSPESGNRSTNGSIEIVRGKESVHVAVQLPQMPRYHEQMIVDMLVKKLATEHGDPPKKPKPPPPPAGDAGAPDGDAPPS
jgi:hypothetical protein